MMFDDVYELDDPLACPLCTREYKDIHNFRVITQCNMPHSICVPCAKQMTLEGMCTVCNQKYGAAFEWDKLEVLIDQENGTKKRMLMDPDTVYVLDSLAKLTEVELLFSSMKNKLNITNAEVVENRQLKLSINKVLQQTFKESPEIGWILGNVISKSFPSVLSTKKENMELICQLFKDIGFILLIEETSDTMRYLLDIWNQRSTNPDSLARENAKRLINRVEALLYKVIPSDQSIQILIEGYWNCTFRSYIDSLLNKDSFCLIYNSFFDLGLV